MSDGAATIDMGMSHDVLHDMDGTIESLSRLLEDMRAQLERQAADADALRDELSCMHDREASLNEALVRLRHWLALDAEAMLSPGALGARTDLAGLEAGAEQLRHEADANRRIAADAAREREDAEQSLHDLRRRLDESQSRLTAVTQERDQLLARLQEHEALLKTAGLEIEWRPTKPGRTR